jgi:hypothetical protein
MVAAKRHVRQQEKPLVVRPIEFSQACALKGIFEFRISELDIGPWGFPAVFRDRPLSS